MVDRYLAIRPPQFRITAAFPEDKAYEDYFIFDNLEGEREKIKDFLERL